MSLREDHWHKVADARAAEILRLRATCEELAAKLEVLLAVLRRTVTFNRDQLPELVAALDQARSALAKHAAQKVK